MTDIFLSSYTVSARLAAAEELFLFVGKKKQKPLAENFSFEVSGMAWVVLPEKFVRPGLSRTEVWCSGRVGRNFIST